MAKVLGMSASSDASYIQFKVEAGVPTDPKPRSKSLALIAFSSPTWHMDFKRTF